MSNRDQRLNITLSAGEKMRFEFLAAKIGVSVSAMLRHLVAQKIVMMDLWDDPKVQDSISMDRESSTHDLPT